MISIKFKFPNTADEETTERTYKLKKGIVYGIYDENQSFSNLIKASFYSRTKDANDLFIIEEHNVSSNDMSDTRENCVNYDYIESTNGFLPFLSVKENLEWVSMISTKRDPEIILKQFDMLDEANFKPSSLSSHKQLVLSVMMGLMRGVSLIIIDSIEDYKIDTSTNAFFIHCVDYYNVAILIFYQEDQPVLDYSRIT